MNAPIRPSGISKWKQYNAAALGLRDYWYPVMESRRVRRRPMPVELLGDKVALVRERGRVYAFEDRCPHRSIPFTGAGTPIVGKFDFPEHITCPYHGWVFELKSGCLAAALTDGPDSPIVGKVK